MTKQEVYNALKNGETLYTPSWYITMETFGGEHIYMTCGYEDCCQDDYDNFEEFWEMYDCKNFSKA